MCLIDNLTITFTLFQIFQRTEALNFLYSLHFLDFINKFYSGCPIKYGRLCQWFPKDERTFFGTHGTFTGFNFYFDSKLSISEFL